MQWPGGWKGSSVEVEDQTTVAALRKTGVSFRDDVAECVGGKQTMFDGAPGNPL